MTHSTIHQHDHEQHESADRRRFLKSGLAGAAAVAAAGLGAGTTQAQAAQPDPYAPPENPALPPSDMVLDHKRTALVVTDPRT